MTIRGPHITILVGALALCLLSVYAVRPLVRGDERTSIIGDTETASEVFAGRPTNIARDEEQSVRLNHISAPWQKVLNDLAKDTNSTLVVHDLPPGRFSRHDWKKHSRTEAVRILNQQLEPEGYRLLEKGSFLTILKMEQARSTYRRPVSPIPASHSRKVTQVAHAEEGPAEPPTHPTARQQADAMRTRRRFDSITQQLKQDSQLLQTNGTSGDQSVITSEFTSELENVGPQHSQVPVEPTYRPQHRSAVDLFRLLYRSFEPRTKLIEYGPRDLPALQVMEQTIGTRDSLPWFMVEIDTENNLLQFTASDETVRGVLNLIQRCDRPLDNSKRATQIVQGTPETLHIGRQLEPELARFRQQRLQELRRSSSVSADQVAFQDDRNAPQPPAAEQPPESGVAPGRSSSLQDQLPAILNGLRGDVTLEALDDLNLLILRGNEQDIDQVMEVINAIERLAVGSRPDIHLLFLQHVNSFALAELLTSLYEELADLRNVNALQGAQTVKVVAVGSPNAVMILAPQGVMESILSLAQELDIPGDPQDEVEIFTLRHAVATQVKTTLDEFYAERGGLGPRVRVSVDVRTNTVIVHARPRDLEEVRLIIRKIDRGTTASANQMRVIPLQHAVADELSEFLNTTIQGVINPPTQTAAGGGFGGAASQGPQELRDTRSVVLEFLTTDGVAQQLIRSGLLSEVRVTADLRTNSLTVVAPKQTLVLMEELIHILDQPSATVAEIKVFQLENADATTAVTLLNELFESEEQGALDIAIAGAEDASSSLIPLKFSTDTRTNTVVAIGGAEALRVVEAILLRLDQSDLRQRKQVVFKLRNSPAADVAQAINDFIQAQLDLVQIDANLVSTSELVDQTYIVVPEAVTNSLIISASPRYFDEILRLAEQLDAEPPQVMIQAMLVEVELTDTDEFGIELGFQDSVLFDRSVTAAENLLTTVTTISDPGTGIQTTTQNIISQAATPGFQFNNQPLGNNIAGNPGKVGTQGLSNFALGRTNADLGFGGLVLSASSDAVSVLVRALEARRDVRILSRPQVMALDNQAALIQEGQTVPTVNGVTTTGLVTSPTVQQTNVGIILSVTPRISPEGQVVMVVEAQKSGLSGSGVPIYVDANTGAVIEAPIIDVTLASTTVKVNDGQTVVLGGMIIEQDSTLERKVPWLGDVPIIGQAFRYDANDHRRSELLVFLTPRIVYNDADFELIKQVEVERLHFFEHEAEEIHGPLFAVPPESYEEEYGDEVPTSEMPLIDEPPLLDDNLPTFELTPTD
ncbi:MAG: secretin N-terminal domain-containing protein [Planctomycetaceae bacterium]